MQWTTKAKSVSNFCPRSINLLKCKHFFDVVFSDFFLIKKKNETTTRTVSAVNSFQEYKKLKFKKLSPFYFYQEVQWNLSYSCELFLTFMNQPFVVEKHLYAKTCLKLSSCPILWECWEDRAWERRNSLCIGRSVLALEESPIHLHTDKK